MVTGGLIGLMGRFIYAYQNSAGRIMGFFPNNNEVLVTRNEEFAQFVFYFICLLLLNPSLYFRYSGEFQLWDCQFDACSFLVIVVLNFFFMALYFSDNFCFIFVLIGRNKWFIS
ncbi:NADH-ubiquinone oxidoreductase subunit [Quillaja saponaria]|uniref:NADH-ubiquinone oxidoreductase subunit n=1 Tax=Quillaja saponaria TaxID=32244 RepID=A0AAD7M0Q9_QUISA|nr:NADH-ubiquinone oxidoreductase subunit [Quillaja saponaria]